MDLEKNARTRPKWQAWLTSTQPQIILFFIVERHSEGTVHLKHFSLNPTITSPLHADEKYSGQEK